MRSTRSRPPVPRGFTLPELLLAVLLSGILLSAAAALLEMAGRVFRTLLETAEQAEIRRTIAAVLLEELGRGVEGVDWTLESSQAIQLRAFRGEARGCAVGQDGKTLVVLRRGERQAEAARDSVLILEQSGNWRPGLLLHVRTGGEPGMPLPAACMPAPGERLERWEVGVAAPSTFWVPVPSPGGVPFFLRYFESGRYSLEDGAFRYRRGTAGRQPLTLERVAPASRFESVPGGMTVRLTLSSDQGPAEGEGWSWVVQGGRAPGPLLGLEDLR
jgi:prepilin-type N-terminal cleavage/methylation domain-containing protein